MFRNRPITRKLMTVILLTSGTVLALTCGTFLVYELVTFRQSMVRSLSILAKAIATNSTAALAFENADDGAQVLSALAADPHVVAGALYDRSGAIFASYTNPPGESSPLPTRPDDDGYRFGPTSLVLHEPVVIDNRRLGTLYLHSDLGAMYQRFTLYGGIVVGVIAAAGLVGFVLATRLQRHITEPVVALARTAKSVSEREDYSIRAKRFDDDELGQLTDAFNAMLARIHERDRALVESQQHYRALAESLPHLVWTCRPDGYCDFLSRQWVEYTGRPAEEQLGYGWAEQLHPEDRDRVRSEWARAVTRGDRFDIEFRIRRADGAFRWFKTRAVPLRNADGEIVKWFGSNTDFEDSKQALVTLAQAEERFRSVVEAAPNAMLMVDHERRIALVNRKGEELFGYRREELIGEVLEILVPEQVRDAHPQYVESFHAAPVARPMGVGRELYGRRKDGTPVPVEIGLSPLGLPEGPYTLASIIDVTERKRMDDELRRSNADLEQFAYVASHDLQEPLRMVASYTDLLAKRYRGQLDERADKFMHYITDGAKRMQRLVADLLAYSRIGSRGRQMRPVSAETMLKSVLESLGPLIRESGATIEVASPLPTVLADETQLMQLLQNLIGNAIKFRSEAPPRVVIDAVMRDRRWRFSVRDNGIGLDARYAERIFQMFQRLHERGQYEGSGIGLAIAKKIVEGHGGRIWLESTQGAGTTFFFTLNPAR